MVDGRYGSIFKQIRQQKQLPLSYFEKVGVMKSNLARFERGETMIGAERLVSLLHAMNVSLAEYELILNYYIPDIQEHYLFEIEQANIFLDTDRLEKLYKEIKLSGNRLLMLSVKSKLKKLTCRETNEIVSYLNNVKQWGFFELTLTHDIVECLDTETMTKFLREFDLKNKKNYDIMKYRRKIHQIAYTAVLILTSRNEKKLAEEILVLTDILHHDIIDFYVSTFRKLALGFVCYQFEDRDKGWYLMNHSFELFEDLGSKDLRKFYEQKIAMLEHTCPPNFF